MDVPVAHRARSSGGVGGRPSGTVTPEPIQTAVLTHGELKPHKVGYYVERRDPEFHQKMPASSTRSAKAYRSAAAASTDIGGDTGWKL
jgi:hypothetical protein